MTKKAKYVYLFPNQMLAVCDENGAQISELQGMISAQRLRDILDRLDINTEFKFNCEFVLSE